MAPLGPQGGQWVTGDGEVYDLAEILGARIRAGSLYGSLTIGTTATPLRLGTSNLEDRHSVYVINTGNDSIFIGFDPSVTVDNGIPIGVGEERGFDLDPNNGIDLYAIASTSVTVRMLEVK